MSEVWTETSGFGGAATVASSPAWDALCLGDGVLETVRRADDGTWLFVHAHAARAARTWRMSYGRAPELVERLVGAMLGLADAPRDWRAMRLFVMPTETCAPWVWAARLAWTPPNAAAYVRGATCIRSRIPHPGLGALGKTTSYHWARSAQREARSQGATDALLEGPNGAIVEAATAALVWREGERWFAPEGPALASVTLSALWERQGPLRDAVHAPASWARLERADEVLLLSSLRLAMRVGRLGARSWPAGATAAAWRSYLLERGAGE